MEQWHLEYDSSTKHDVGKRPGRFELLRVHVDQEAFVVCILAVHLSCHLYPFMHVLLIHPKHSVLSKSTEGPEGTVQICIRHLRSKVAHAKLVACQWFSAWKNDSRRELHTTATLVWNIGERSRANFAIVFGTSLDTKLDLLLFHTRLIPTWRFPEKVVPVNHPF